VRRFRQAGTCEQGTCVYEESIEQCGVACRAGECVVDLCAGVVCATPPPATCLDASTRRTFAFYGSCSAGVCTYAADDQRCSSGCKAGVCAGNPCQAVACHTPPPPTCLDALTVRSYSGAGTCVEGACSYSASTAACTFGCAQGKCRSARATSASPTFTGAGGTTWTHQVTWTGVTYGAAVFSTASTSVNPAVIPTTASFPQTDLAVPYSIGATACFVVGSVELQATDCAYHVELRACFKQVSELHWDVTFSHRVDTMPLSGGAPIVGGWGASHGTASLELSP